MVELRSVLVFAGEEGFPVLALPGGDAGYGGERGG